MEQQTLEDSDNTGTAKVFNQATPFTSLSGSEFYWSLETA
jgi:hypothetical protein